MPVVVLEPEIASAFDPGASVHSSPSEGSVGETLVLFSQTAHQGRARQRLGGVASGRGQHIRGGDHRHPGRQLGAVLGNVAIDAGGVAADDPAVQRRDPVETPARFFGVVELRHRDIVDETRLPEVSRQFTAPSQVSTADLLCMVLGLRVAEPEGCRFLGIRKDVRNAVGIAPDGDALGEIVWVGKLRSLGAAGHRGRDDEKKPPAPIHGGSLAQ